MRISINAVEDLVANAPTNISEQDILNGLKRKGYEIEGLTFGERFKSSFGTAKVREQAKRAEVLSGQSGRVDIGDIADIAGGSIPFLTSFIGAMGGTAFGLGVGGAVGAGIGATAGESVRRTVGQALGVREDVTPIEEASGALGVGAATTVSGKALPLVGRAARGVVGGVGRTARGTGRVLIGDKGASAISKTYEQPRKVTDFQSGVETLQGIADKTTKAVSSLKKSTKGVFDAAESKLKVIPIRNAVPKNGLDFTIKETLDIPSNAVFSIDDLAQTGMGDKEVRVIEKLLSKVSGTKIRNTKDILALKRQVNKGGFFKGDGGHNTSDAIVSKYVDFLNELLADVDKDFAQATAQSAKDIRMLNQLGFNVLGRSKLSVEQTATKLGQVMTKIDTPQGRQATKDLILKLERQTGVNIIQDLEALSAAEFLSKPIPGLIESPFMAANQNLIRTIAALTKQIGKVAGN